MLKHNLYYTPDVVSYSDYLPFGQVMPNRHGDDNQYRYGFNGKEKDNEIKGEGNSYTSFYRMLDPRIGRWLSTDPEEDEFPDVTPYCSVDNNPIWKEDENGDFWNYVVGAVVGGAVEYASQVASNVYSKGFSSKAFYDDVDFADVGAATVEGALTSGASAIKRTSTKIAVKAAIEISSEITKNAVDKKGGKSIKTNDAKTVLKNTAIGLTVNKVGDKAAGKLGEKIIPKKAQLSVPNKKTGVNEARAKAAQNGNHLTTQQRKVLENKNIQKKAVNKHVNETIKKAPVNTVKGAAGNKAKEATD
jgi:RHS repeat-associated protein